MAGDNHTDARLVAYGGDDAVQLYARDAEYDLNALSLEGLNEGFASTHFDHSPDTPVPICGVVAMIVDNSFGYPANSD